MLLSIIRKAVIICNYFFLFYLIVYSTYTLVCAIFGSIRMYQYRRLELLHNVIDHDYFYPMSILVPAYNESIAIVQTVKNLMHLDYQLFEIIVIDDGSKDDTKQLVIDTFDLKREYDRPIRYSLECKPINEVYTGMLNNISITLISKENGGCKADATNAGINVSQYPYIVNMDGDEILQKDSLKYASRAILESDNVIAVGGNIKMSNYVTFRNAVPIDSVLGKNLVVDMQVVEYGRAFVSSRIFQNLANINLIVSGGFGIFKKAALLEVGGFDQNSMGEDMELTVKLHQHYRKNKIPYSIKYVPDSVCWTQGPETMHDLRKQRERWYCGLYQTLKKYRYMIMNPRYGAVGLFMLPYMILYELLNPFLMLLGWIVIGWTFYDHTINFPYVLYVYIAYIIFGIFMSVISYLDKIYMKRDYTGAKNILLSFGISVVDSLFFRQFLSCVSFFAFFKVKKIAKSWVSPARVVVKSEE